MADTARDSQILSRWRSGEDGVQIAKALGIGSTSVYRVLKRHGLKPTGQQRPKEDWRRKFTREQEREIGRRYLAGEHMAAIATDVGCDRLTVRNILFRQQIPPRPVGRPLRQWSDEEIEDIVQRYREGELIEDIAKTHSTDDRTISRFVRGLGGRKGKLRRPGGGITTIRGYRAVMVTYDDPMASMRSSGGYVMEHRLVMARHLGRPLRPNETVHHINGDKLDNRLENLQLRQGRHGKHQAFRCLDCGSTNVEPVTL